MYLLNQQIKLEERLISKQQGKQKNPATYWHKITIEGNTPN